MKPILFKTEMVIAILNGSKTQTRRLCKIQPEEDCYYIMNFNNGIMELDYNAGDKNPTCNPKYKTGDILYVRETFNKDDGIFYYRADGINGLPDCLKQVLIDNKFDFSACEWKPSLFMPKEAARLFLKVTNVRCERLQDITEEDCIREGILKMDNYFQRGFDVFFDYLAKEKAHQFPHSTNNNRFTAKDSYKSLWQKINGKDSWDLNPFVFVYEFEEYLTHNQ